MTTTSCGEWAPSKQRQQDHYADLAIRQWPEDTIGLNLFLLLGPERIREIFIQGRILRIDLL
jgi:hypothetical protein